MAARRGPAKEEIYHMERKDFHKVFGIKNLPEVDHPVVLIAGTVRGLTLEGEKTHIVKTIHGNVLLKYGKIRGQDVVLIHRHTSEPMPGKPSTAIQLLPHSSHYEAHALVAAALDPKAIITLSAMGVHPGTRKQPRRIGDLCLVGGGVPGTARTGNIFTEAVQRAIGKMGYDVANIAHTALGPARIQGKTLAAMAHEAARKAGARIGPPVVVYTSCGPHFEYPHETRAMVRSGISAFSMTHHTETTSLAFALNAAGSTAEMLQVCLATNYAQGYQPADASHAEVKAEAKKQAKTVRAFLSNLVENIGRK